MLRVVKLPVVALACLTAGILIGTALTPVLAQRMSGSDGQVAVRSDYAVYLITGGQRRWVSTVMINDQEINAYPEGEPIFTGLIPGTGQTASSAPPTAIPTATPYPMPTDTPTPYPPVNQYPGSQPPGNQPPYQPPSNQPSNQPAVLPPHLSNQQPPGPLPSGSVGSTGGGNQSPGWYPTPTPFGGQYYPTPTPYGGQYYPTPTPYGSGYDPNAPSSQIDPNLPLEVYIDGSMVIERNNTLRVVLRTRPNAQCELTVRWPDGGEAQQPGRTADGQGRCEFSMRVGSSAPTGAGLLRGSVRDAGYQSRQSIQFQVVSSL